MRPHDAPRPGPPAASAGEVRCPSCGGTGFRIVTDPSTGRSYARRCDCALPDRARTLLARARIPRRYQGCDFQSFLHGPGYDPTLRFAFGATRDFVEDYTARKLREEAEFGLLLLGPPGVGKTHLAVAALRSLILDQGVAGLFADFRDLIKSLQASYDPLSPDSETQVLRPLIQAEVLVLDDLGASRMTEWVRDMVGHIVNSRYNDRRVTLITSNLADDAGGVDSERPALTDRIGPAVRSRLHEMCVVVQLDGKDFRRRSELKIKGTGKRDRRH